MKWGKFSLFGRNAEKRIVAYMRFYKALSSLFQGNTVNAV